MGKIHVLDKQTAELIAAGEVVDRPASVIKELTENAVDAGASTITVEIRRGGITFMRVTDDGSGMDREDVPVAFVRHATSKVRRREDLDGIGTLGFRGEAVASIGAVAHVEVLTRRAEDLEGTRFEMNGGEPGETAAVGCPRGTTILVRDLFYNTPARMKFLKKDVSEANAVAAMMDRLALSHPEISFRFIRDGKETLHTPGDGKIRSAVYAVYGREFTSQLLPVEYEFSHVKVEGFVSAPAASRGSRSMQHFFLNGRYVRSRTAMAALEEACKGSIMVGRYPACILYITMNTHAVDVNVHPAKLEVRFVNERPVYDGVYHGVKSALLQKDAPRTMQLPGGPGLSRQNVPLTGTQTVLDLGEKLQAAPGGRPIAGEPAVSRQPQPIAAGQVAAHSVPAVPAKNARFFAAGFPAEARFFRGTGAPGLSGAKPVIRKGEAGNANGNRSLVPSASCRTKGGRVFLFRRKKCLCRKKGVPPAGRSLPHLYSSADRRGRADADRQACGARAAFV